MIRIVLCCLAGFVLIGYGVYCYVERIKERHELVRAVRGPSGEVFLRYDGAASGLRTPCYTVKGQKGVNGGGDGGDATICGSGVAIGGAGGGRP